MEERKPPNESKPILLAEISFEDIPAGEGPVAPPVRNPDPGLVAEHFAPLLPSPPSAEERWRQKLAGTPFPSL